MKSTTLLSLLTLLTTTPLVLSAPIAITNSPSLSTRTPSDDAATFWIRNPKGVVEPRDAAAAPEAFWEVRNLVDNMEKKRDANPSGEVRTDDDKVEEKKGKAFWRRTAEAEADEVEEKRGEAFWRRIAEAEADEVEERKVTFWRREGKVEEKGKREAEAEAF